MRHGFTNRVETYVGIALILVVIIGFVFSVLTSLPTSTKVNQQAVVLKEIPRDLFSSQNEVNKLISGLNTPAGVPVTVDPNTLGRANVFQTP